MSRIERAIGLSPVLKRLAFHYLRKGVGRHPIFGHPIYDSVVVKDLYDWNSPNDELPPQGGLVVEFHQKGKKIRFVEFSIVQTGGGGESILREVL